MTRGQLTLDEMLQATVSAPAPEGLTFEADAIDESQERDLLERIDAQPWSPALNRRVQHYGWRYDYKRRRVGRDAYLGRLPTFLDPMVDRLEARWGFRPDQAIVNEYLPGQGIAPHVDCEPCFGPVVAMVGLGSAVQMDFESRTTGARWELNFLRRGLLVLSGPSRFDWAHGIAKRRTDSALGCTRSRRVSVTFRTVIVDS